MELLLGYCVVDPVSQTTGMWLFSVFQYPEEHSESKGQKVKNSRSLLKKLFICLLISIEA